MKGNEAVAAAAIKAGCKLFFGYPITPQNEICEYFARELPKNNGVFLQAESEIAAINMVYGAAGCGIRAMTSSSSPGIALKQEGISYIAGARLPCVIVNMMRCGPGLGGILPSQADYNQVTKGGGNGDYKVLVYAPSGIQEMIDLVIEAFDVADFYRNPVMIVADGMLGQMMEAVEFKEPKKRKLPDKSDWTTTGTKNKRMPHLVSSLFLDPEELEQQNIKSRKKYEEMQKNETKYEKYNCSGAEIIIVAYGTTARIAKNAIDKLQKEGINTGLIRPITLCPFPNKAFDEIPDTTKSLLTVEMSQGQMIDDVKIAANGRWSVDFYGRSGGMVPDPDSIATKIKKMLGVKK